MPLARPSGRGVGSKLTVIDVALVREPYGSDGDLAYCVGQSPSDYRRLARLDQASLWKLHA